VGFAHELIADQPNTNCFAHDENLRLIGRLNGGNLDAVAKRVSAEESWPPRDGDGISTGDTCGRESCAQGGLIIDVQTKVTPKPSALGLGIEVELTVTDAEPDQIERTQ
jgi:hypothetical protein